MAVQKQFEWKHEDGSDRVLTMPVEPSVFMVNDTADVSRNFTNSGYVESSVFSSYMTIELAFTFMTANNLFVNEPHVSLHASIQHFYQYIKRGGVFGFTWNYDRKREMQVDHENPQIGSQQLYLTDNVIIGQYIYLTNSRGDHEVFLCNQNGGIYPNPTLVYPTMSLQYEVDDMACDWPYFPRLEYLGGSLNEGYDSTGLYYSMSLKARTVKTT